MTQYQVTLNDQTLQRLFSGDSQLAQLLESIRNQVLEAQVSEHLRAERYEQIEERQGYRNGYKPHQLTTRVGTLTVRVPQVREGNFSNELFAHYQHSEQALVLTLMEMVVNGVSTCKVARITEELYGREFSQSSVADLSKTLGPLVEAWNERDLSPHRYPFLIVDALVVTVREGGRVRSCSALIAKRTHRDGCRFGRLRPPRRPHERRARPVPMGKLAALPDASRGEHWMRRAQSCARRVAWAGARHL